MRKFITTLATLIAMATPITAQEALATLGTGSQPLLIRSTTDFAIIRPALERFVDMNPDLTITYEQWNSNPLYAKSKAGCAGTDTPADVVFSSAVQQMVDLVNAACAYRYRSDLTASLPPSRRWRDELWGLTEEPAVMIYNRDLIDPADVPRDRFALLDLMRREPEMLRGKIATYDIEQSGLGYLFAYSDSLEATTFGALLEGFARTDAVATCCSAEIINGVADGTYALAYNVLGSYVANGVHSTVGLILPEDYTLFLSRGFMIPKRAQNPQAATRLLDFLLSPEGQAQIKQAGLTFPQDAGDTGLIPSARRFITLSPALLVPLDAQKLDRFAEFWSSNFVSPPLQ